MTPRRAALASALVAVLVYLPSLGNRFALDDTAIIERNPAAHGIGAALHAFAHPYWPPEHGAGLWRPVVILSFAADWQLSGGNAAWMHAVNILLHAVLTLLVVLVIAPWVGRVGALAGGILFAIHPVHVEAVANLVGRAEILVAIGLLAAILLAREADDARAQGRSSMALEAAALAAVAFALLSKEHAVIAVALLWLDGRARPDGPRVPNVRLLAAVLALTVAWLVIRRSVEGGASFAAVAPTFFHLGPAGRISTMLPAVLVVFRLLCWPFDLSPDYHPRVIERLTHLTPAGVLGLVELLALAALSLLLWKRHRAAAFAIMVIGLAWLPTSNLFFPTGIVLAERTLYLASVGVALLAGLAADWLVARSGTRAAILLAVGALPLAWTTIARIPAWRSTRDLVVTALLAHPESYRVHESAARVLWRLGLHEPALAEYHVAAELYPLDPYMLTEMGGAALEAGHLRDAMRVLGSSRALDTTFAMTDQLLAQAWLRAGNPQRALAFARLAVALGPTQAQGARMLAAAFIAVGRPDSALAVWPAFQQRGGREFDRWMFGALTYQAAGLPDSARIALRKAELTAPSDTLSLRQLADTRREIAAKP